MELLLTQPGLHLSRVEEVLLSLVQGVKDQLLPLSLNPEEAPKLGQLVVAYPDTVRLRTTDRCNDSCPLQDILDPALVALQLPLKCLEESQGTTKGKWSWLLDILCLSKHIEVSHLLYTRYVNDKALKTRYE